jgi:hypothetical protein
MTTDYEPGKSPIIRNLLPGLTEIGKIKIGRKGELRKTNDGREWRVPVKLDHFVVTTLERDKNDNFVIDERIMKLLGENQKRIPMRLLYDALELNFLSRYSCYHGKTLWCSGDGRGAFRTNAQGIKEPVTCPCGREQPGYKGPEKCKMNGALSCIIDGADVVGGVWKFRTTGYNSTVGIMSSLLLIQAMSGGLLAGLDLDMTIQPKVGTDPDGKSVTIQVVGIQFRGSIQALHKKALEIASSNADFRIRLANVEVEARKMIGVDAELIDQAADIVEEFHPDQEPAPQLVDPTKPPVVALQPAAAASGTAAAAVPAQQSSPGPVTAPQVAPVPPQAPEAQSKPAARGRPRKAVDAPASAGAPSQTSAPALAVPPLQQPAPVAAPVPSSPPEPAAPPMSVPDGLDTNLFDLD